MRTLSSIIAGQFAAQNGPCVEVKSPFDGHVVCRVTRATPEQIETAIARAHAARDPMRAMPRHERARILDEISRKVVDTREQLARLLVDEAGKPIALARVEADRCAQTFVEASRCARLMEDQAFPLDGYAAGTKKMAIVRRFPIGVIAAITPFNFPLNLAAHKIAPAIAAGCPVVLKPASQTPSVALGLARMAQEAGLPDGALSILLLSGSEASEMLDDERIAMVSFTGSAEVGWALKARFPMKRVTLELGGNAAAIVESDANIETAARKLALGAFGYAGQSCISVQRVFVHQSVARSLSEALVAAAEGFGCGDPSDEFTFCGPLIDEANADRVMEWIKEADCLGGRIECGGTRQGNIVAPTVVVNAPQSARLNCNEVFGPVVSLAIYSEFDDAIRAVNDSRYGLQAGIFTNDWTRIWQAFESLEVGGLIQNDSPTFRVDLMPYGGVKLSGIGREGPRWAIEEMTEPRLLVLQT